MTTYVPARYDERTFHLALGIEPRDGTSGFRLPSGVDVRVEQHPSPLGSWRPWRPGETLTAVLPRMHRHRSGRFVHRYDQRLPSPSGAGGSSHEVTIRLVDDGSAGAPRVPGAGRRIVPRRLRVSIATEDVVLAAEGDPAQPGHPVWRRAFPVWCFPGAAADLPSHATVLRGRIERVDPSTGAVIPVRWARVRVAAEGGAVLAWAHGDDRGEYVAVLEPSDHTVNVLADPIPVHLTIGATLPAPTGDPADPLRPQVDPLWDLPVEAVVPSPSPEQEPSLTGRGFLPGHTQLSPLAPVQPFSLPHGRETSVVIRIA